MKSLTIFFIFLLVGCTAPPTQPPPAETKAIVWEYKILRYIPQPDQKLNELGAEGWELIAVDSRDEKLPECYLRRIKP